MGGLCDMGLVVGCWGYCYVEDDSKLYVKDDCDYISSLKWVMLSKWV